MIYEIFLIRTRELEDVSTTSGILQDIKVLVTGDLKVTRSEQTCDTFSNVASPGKMISPFKKVSSDEIAQGCRRDSHLRRRLNPDSSTLPFGVSANRPDWITAIDTHTDASDRPRYSSRSILCLAEDRPISSRVNGGHIFRREWR